MKIFNKSFVFCLILLGLNLRSQNYIPMPLQNCYWLIYPTSGTYNPNTMSTCMYADTFKIVPQGDTLIAAKHYVKFYSYYVGGSGVNISPPCNPYTAPTNTVTYYYAVRQDTLARKLYMVYPNSTIDQLMFDFSQVAGDTVKAISGKFGSTPPCGTTGYRVIDTVFYRYYSDGLCHKVYKLKPFANCVGLTANTEIIEGFGNETGLEIKVKAITNSQSYANAMLIINSSALSISVSNVCQGVGIQENGPESLMFYPNPVLTIAYVNVQASKKTKLSVYNATGCEVKMLVVKNNDKISLDFSDLASGYYYIKYNSETQSWVKKIIKVDP